MHISVKGLRVVGIRTTYVPAKGRGVGSQVISFRSYHETIEEIRRSEAGAAEQLENLRPEELEKLESWLSSRAEKRANATSQSALPNLERQLDLALAALSTEPGQKGLSPELASRLYGKVRELQQKMRKLGHPRPKVGK